MKGTFKRLCAAAVAVCMAVCLTAVPAFADDTQGKSYVVVFYPGEHGSFTQSYLDGLVQRYGEDNVKTTEAGGVALLLASGEAATMAPQPTDIQLSDERYVLTDTASGFEAENGQIHTDSNGVAQYALRQQGQEGSYVVRYLDQETGEEVAPVLRGMANLNSQITLYPVAADEYTPVGGPQTVTITAGENEIIFYYTPVVHTNTVTEYLPGGTVIEYDDTAVGGGAVVVGPEEGEDIGETETPPGPGEETETIDDNETPLTSGEDSENIDDNETPLTSGEDESSGLATGVVVGGAAAVAVVCGLVWWARKRNKKA